MTFHINSPLGAGTTFATGSVSSVGGERGLGFFRLNVTVELIIEPAGSSVGQPDLPQITELMAEIRIAGRPVGRFIPMPGYLPARSYPERSNRASIPLTCDLDRARVAPTRTHIPNNDPQL